MNKGFTLIELVLTVSLVSVVVALLGYTFTEVYTYYKQGETRQTIDLEGQVVMQRLQYQLQNSVEINNPEPGEVATDISFLDITGKNISYQYIDNSLFVSEEGEQAIRVTSSRVRVSQWEISRSNTDGEGLFVRIQFTLTDNEDNLPFQDSYQKQFTGGVYLPNL